MNLLLFEPGEVSDGGAVEVNGPRADHLCRVLKVSPGSTVRVGVIDGPVGTGIVEAVQDGRVTLRCAFGDETPDRPAVDLLLALPRPKVMRRLWAQVAAIGVGRVFVANAERVERDYFDTHILSPGTYRPLLVEGLQQARDTRLPCVSVHRRLKVLVEDELDALTGHAVRLVADPSAGTSPADALAGRQGQRVLLAVGPEGGWNAYERSLFATHGFTAIGMGPRTLRTDTATVALLTLVHQARRASDPEAR